MKLTSPAFESNQPIPKQFTCDGKNINPPLHITDVPNGSKSLVLIVDDPDAPAGTWVHWTVWNISPETNTIEQHSLPPGAVEGLTSFGKTGYGGPCPPKGTHRYFFKLFALDTRLTISSGEDCQTLIAELQNHVIDQVEFIGLYQR